jgi:hypothetical protein
VHIEVVDALRCVGQHEDTWLVASAEEWADRRIVRGRLGCPVCRVVYPVSGRVADFTTSASPPGGAAVTPAAIDDADVLRLAALLDLREAGGVLVLGGSYAALADRLMGVVEAHYVALNTDPLPLAASGLRVDARVPLARGSVRGVAVDETVDAALLGDLVRTLRPGGRFVAPADVPVPGGLGVLARDEREWVAESVVARTPAVTLSRRR